MRGAFERLLESSVLLAKAAGLLTEEVRAAVDATGLESRHVSRYFFWRRGSRHLRLNWPKLTVVCDLATHFWLSAFICMGPCQDSPQFEPTVRQAVENQRIDQLLGDKGYDAEHNHRLCREELNIHSTLIPVRKKSCLSRNRTWPKTPYRREMKRVLANSDFGQRWQIESSFSRHKRLLGPALRARNWATQQSECLMRVLTHNVMLLAAA